MSYSPIPNLNGNSIMCWISCRDYQPSAWPLNTRVPGGSPRDFTYNFSIRVPHSTFVWRGGAFRLFHHRPSKSPPGQTRPEWGTHEVWDSHEVRGTAFNPIGHSPQSHVFTVTDSTARWTIGSCHAMGPDPAAAITAA